MRRATTIRKHRARGRRTSAPAYFTTSGQIPPRTPHRMSVPSIVESLNAHRYFEHQRAKAAMTRLVSTAFLSFLSVQEEFEGGKNCKHIKHKILKTVL
jgi:hypothetical protein